MKRNGVLITIALVLSVTFAASALAETVIIDKEFKLDKVTVYEENDTTGLAFTVKSASDLNGCDNEFIILDTATNFKLKSVAILTAIAAKRKVSVEFDNEYPSCPMEVTSFDLH